MKSMVSRILAGVFALATMLLAVPAAAQVVPGRDHGVDRPVPQLPAERPTYDVDRGAPALPAERPYVGTELEREFVIVEGDLESVNNRHTPPGVARYLAREGRHTRLYRDEWQRLGWSDADFNQARGETYGFCLRTELYTLRLAELARRYQGLNPQIIAIREHWLRLGGIINGSEAISHLGSIGSGVAAGIVSSGYALPIQAPVLVGNIAQNHAFSEQMRVAREAGILNNEQTALHNEFSLLATEVYIDYLSMMTDYCGQFLNTYPTPVAAAPAATDEGSYYEYRSSGTRGYSAPSQVGRITTTNRPPPRYRRP